MFESVVLGGQWQKVRWSVIGAVPIDVVNVLSIGNTAVGYPVFVGLDVFIRGHSPAETNVSMGSDVPLRFILRNFHPRFQLSNSCRKALVSAGTTELLLDSTRDCSSANSAWLGDDHSLIIQVTAMCHATFTGISAFDAHRIGQHEPTGKPGRNVIPGPRRCADPTTVGLIDAGRGYPCWGFPGADDRWEADQ